MKYSYRSGQPIPRNVEDLIHYLAKVGTITTSGWKRFFVSGGDRWQRAQLAGLLEREIIDAHSCPSVSDAWVLGSWSKALLKNERRVYVTPVSPQQILHDETVGLGLKELENSHLIELWFSEKELKTLAPKDYKLNLGKFGVKYPDATLAFKSGQNVWVVAIEYERSGKDRRRYENIFKAYAELDGIHQIIFITEENSTKERIKAVANIHRESRIGFIDGNNWRKSSLLADIHKGKESEKFFNILHNSKA